MKFKFTSNLLSASSLLICCMESKFTSKKIKLIISLTISFLIFITFLNATDAFAQQDRNFQWVNENKIQKQKFQKTNDATGEVEQNWVAIYNGVGGLRSDEATDIAVDSAGNVYVTGISQGLGFDYDCATIKYDAQGEVQWVNRYDGGNDDYSYKLALDDSANVYITGSSYSTDSGEDYLTIKYSTDGVEQWVRKYNGPGNSFDRSYTIAVDESGNACVTGQSYDVGGNSDYTTIKYNTLGNEQWVKRYNGPQNDYDEAVGIAIDNFDNVVVTGKSIGINNHYNYATIKYNGNGIEQWIRRYISAANHSEVPYAIAVDSSGNVYVAGSGASMDTTSTTSDYLTIKYDSLGVQQWIAKYNGPGDYSDIAKEIAVDDSRNTYITGWSTGEGGSYDYATIKYDPSGTEQWVSRFNCGFVYDLAVDHSGNVYVTGDSSDSTAIVASTTIKYNTYGEEIWLIRYNGPGGFDQSVAIALDESGNVYVTGITYVPGGIPTFDYATIKYKQKIVPVELTNFSASVTNRHIVLDWETATELNNSGFEILRLAKNDFAWRTIGFVPGYGTTAEPKFYSFNDENVITGIYKYQLKQIDFDGSVDYSDIIEVLFGNPMTFSLEQNFPNPFNSVTIINYSIAEHSFVVLKVYNTLGEEVAILLNEEKDAGKYSLRFNAQELPSGVYLYKLNASGSSGEYNFVKKFILLK